MRKEKVDPIALWEWLGDAAGRPDDKDKKKKQAKKPKRRRKK